MKQHSLEWTLAREEKLTASNFGAAAGLNPHKSRQKLWREIKGIEPPFLGNQFTEYGTLNEPNAIRDYEIHTGNLVFESGFVRHPTLAHIGASPDGLVSSQGSVEAKCKFDGSLYDEVPPHYLAQVYGVMECTKRSWCDFVSWAPSDLNIIRVQYDKGMWESLYELLEEFWGYVLRDEEPKRKSKPKWGM